MQSLRASSQRVQRVCRGCREGAENDRGHIGYANAGTGADIRSERAGDAQ